MAENKDVKEIEEGKTIAWLGYLGILCLIPLLAYKDNKFAKFHGKQGLIFFIAYIILFIVLWILALIFSFAFAPLGILIWVLDIVLWLVVVVFSIIGIIKSLQGEYWKMPIIGNYVEKVKME
jgi:uncharacterized membrane protein